MDAVYLRPEHVLFSAVTSLLIGLLMGTARRPAETEGRHTMVHLEEQLEAREIVGRSESDLANALALMKSSLEKGQRARITICTVALPTEEELENLYLGMIANGFHASRPAAFVAGGIPTTVFDLKKGSPTWVALIPLIVPILTIGLITFGILKIETIARALGPVLIITFLGLIILAVVLRRPAEKYIERGAPRLGLPATSKKALAAR